MFIPDQGPYISYILTEIYPGSPYEYIEQDQEGASLYWQMSHHVP